MLIKQVSVICLINIKLATVLAKPLILLQQLCWRSWFSQHKYAVHRTSVSTATEGTKVGMVYSDILKLGKLGNWKRSHCILKTILNLLMASLPLTSLVWWHEQTFAIFSRFQFKIGEEVVWWTWKQSVLDQGGKLKVRIFQSIALSFVSMIPSQHYCAALQTIVWPFETSKIEWEERSLQNLQESEWQILSIVLWACSDFSYFH